MGVPSRAEAAPGGSPTVERPVSRFHSGAPLPCEAMSDRCDSCGDDGDDLITVQRIYVTFDESHAVTGERLADEFETWCPVCRATYPHQSVPAEA